MHKIVEKPPPWFSATVLKKRTTSHTIDGALSSALAATSALAAATTSKGKSATARRAVVLARLGKQLGRVGGPSRAASSSAHGGEGCFG
jgi:hypothetical protein